MEQKKVEDCPVVVRVGIEFDKEGKPKIGASELKGVTLAFIGVDSDDENETRIHVTLVKKANISQVDGMKG